MVMLTQEFAVMVRQKEVQALGAWLHVATASGIAALKALQRACGTIFRRFDKALFNRGRTGQSRVM